MEKKLIPYPAPCSKKDNIALKTIGKNHVIHFSEGTIATRSLRTAWTIISNIRGVNLK